MGRNDGTTQAIDAPLRAVAKLPQARRAGDEEQRLIAAARDGSEPATEQLVRRHWPVAHRAAYLVVQDAAAAEDIAQESLLAAIDALGRFEDGRPLAPWLHRIVVNNALKWLRKGARRHEVSVDALPELDPEPESAGRGVSDETLRALAALDAEQRAIVVLRHLLEYTPGEIAAALGLPRGTVNSRLRRALDRLADELGEEAR
jgi:RNA polymerase sigma-70 factor, ECF subfamily